MAVLFCPRCQRANPDLAVYCYFDGADLRGRQDGSLQRLAHEFVFPSGRRCQTFDDLAQGMRDEWAAARDLLRQGVFRQFFGGAGRADLAKAAQDAMAQPDADAALTTFLGALPVLKEEAPKLDINPRRFLLGNLLAGEHRNLQLTVGNQGQGVLQGTISVTEGSDWLKLDGPNPAQLSITVPREQKLVLRVDTRALPAGQTYGAKLTVITNGGAIEVLARMDLVARPFTQPPFQGVKTPREMAERMRTQPKAAVPILESGEVGRWFASNGWSYPIRGSQAKGVAGVQQFFEAMGLSKPPVVQLTQSEMRFTCQYPETVRSQVSLQTRSRKWVYASVTSGQPWLKVLTPLVSGPQQANIQFEVDPKLLTTPPPLDGTLQIQANSGQALSVRVVADVAGAPASLWQRAQAALPTARPIGAGWLAPVLAVMLAFVLLRLCLVFVVDLGVRSAAVQAAATRVEQPPGHPVTALGGWLGLPWPSILGGGGGTMPARLLNDEAPAEKTVNLGDFRRYFSSSLLRWLVLLTWWVGALLGAVFVWKRGGSTLDLLFGLLAGAVAGIAGSATLASVFLIVEIVPHLLWAAIGLGSLGVASWLWWVVVALSGWALAGAAAGLMLSLVAPLRRHVVAPVQRMVGGLVRLCGLRGVASMLQG